MRRGAGRPDSSEPSRAVSTHERPMPTADADGIGRGFVCLFGVVSQAAALKGDAVMAAEKVDELAHRAQVGDQPLRLWGDGMPQRIQLPPDR